MRLEDRILLRQVKILLVLVFSVTSLPDWELMKTITPVKWKMVNKINVSDLWKTRKLV